MTTVKAVLIARDEQRCIQRVITSVQPHVDETVVLDTGSVDDTVALARTLGARVERGEWNGDFAAARNAALGLADADYALIIDADEWLISGGESLRTLATNPPVTGIVDVHNTIDIGPEIATQAHSSIRVLPRGARYHGRVHEQPSTRGELVHLPIILGHDGYTDLNNARKRGRNEQLLRAEIQDNDDDGYLRYQLAKDVEIQGRHAEAASLYRQARQASSTTDPWAHAIAHRGLFSLAKAEHFVDIPEWFDWALAAWPNSPDIYYVMADAVLDMGGAHIVDEGTALRTAQRCWRRCLDIGDQPHLADSIIGRGSSFAAANLARLAEITEN